jgi:hypothetical protein
MKGRFNPMFKKPVAVYGIINIRVLPQVGKMVYALDIGQI